MRLVADTNIKSIAMKAFLWGAVGLVVRAGYVMWVVGKYGKTQFSDFLYIHQLAESLAAGNGFTIEGIRIFNQSVGYPAFLSIFYALFGSDVWIALIVNTVLGGVSVALVYLLSLKLFPGMEETRRKMIAGSAALLAVIYPDSLLYCALVSAENLLVPLMLLLLIGLIAGWKSDWMAGAVTGILAAAACSVKAHVLLFCLTIPLIWFVMGKRYLLRTIVTGISALVFLTPWTILNYRASDGSFLPFAAVSGTVMLDGTNPSAVGKPTNRYHLPEEMEKGKHPVELDRLRMRQAFKYIRENPAWYARLCVKKAIHAFSPARDFLFQFRGQDRFVGSFMSRWFPTLFNSLFFVTVMAGVILLRRNRLVMTTGFCLFVAPLILQVIFFAYSRYRFPFLFCLIPFCGLFISVVLRNVIEKEKNDFSLVNK